MKLRSLALTLALLPAALFAAAGNSGTPTPTTPTVIPGGSYATSYVISAPGAYVLGGNRSANTAIYVIEIAAPDVTLDLNGFRLSNGPGGSNLGGGVYVPAPENVEIRNGSIVDPGNFGIRAKFGKGVRVNGVRVAGALVAGIEIETAEAQVDRCHVMDSGTYGIHLIGGASLVSDCVVGGKSSAVGVTVDNGSRVMRTVVRGCGSAFILTDATAVDCIASGSQIGFHLLVGATLRGVESIKNTTGVFTSQLTNVIIGGRISGNTQNWGNGGIYTNGGGNVIQ